MTPFVTPPAHVRTVEQLDADLRRLESQKGEDYAAIRDLRELVGCNHIALIHQGGEMAKLFLEMLEHIKDLKASVARLEAR